MFRMFLWLFGATLVFPFPGESVGSSKTDAQRWADWAVSLAPDPSLFRFSFEQLHEKIGRTVHLDDEGGGAWVGRDPSRGILIIRPMFWENAEHKPVKFNQLLLLMPVADSHGNQVFPLVRDGMRRRLRLWKVSTGKDHFYWEKRNSLVRVSLDKGNFGGSAGYIPDPPPYVIIMIGQDDPNVD